MSTTLPCPQCTLENTYHDGTLYVCADCGFEWAPTDTTAGDEDGRIVRDSNGTVLQDGDAVVLIKDLKVKGLVDRAQAGHQGEKHPPRRRRRPRGRLPHGRRQLHVEGVLSEEGLSGHTL